MSRLSSRLARSLGAPEHGMPRSEWAAQALLAAYVVRRAVRSPGSLTDSVRGALSSAVLLHLACRNFGANSMIRGRHGFFPHIFLPAFEGPHFEEAVRRIVLPHRGPNIAYFSLTGACPCHCEYCFAEAGGSDPTDLGDEPILEVARQLARARVPLVNISGGEPLTRFERLVEAVRILGTGCEVRLFTTGIGLTPARLDALTEAGLRGLFVSLDSTDAAAFDRDRGRPGAFDAALKALQLSAEAGVLTFVNCVVNQHRMTSRAEVEALLRFMESIDPRIVVNFLPQLSTGRGADTDSWLRPEDCEAAADRLVSTARELGRPISMLFGRIDHFVGCPGAGGKLMNVDIHGNVTVCISRATMGNVLEEPFEDIYGRYREACARLKVGFFCCEVSEAGDGDFLDAQASHAALDRFFESREDAEWQRVLDRWGWLLGRLVEGGGSPTG